MRELSPASRSYKAWVAKSAKQPMDVGLAGELNGIEAAVHLRREFPRIPVVLYSIQDDDAYFRAFRRAGILSHYAYVRKTNYLLPAMILPLLQDAMAGRSFIDPEIEARVEEVREKDAQSPLELLEPNERAVARVPVLARAEVEPLRSRAGLYEVTPDHHAIIGEAPEVRGLFLANGFSGHGVMHSPATGRIISEMILDGEARLMDVSSLGAERFAEGRLIEETSVL